jgi:apolipoprotein N-acyltransferase
LVLLTAYVALFPLAWLALARALFPKTAGAPLMMRVVIQLGLAGGWVVLEWLQSWLLSGFPWLLLADTQWRQPAVLTLCAWGGPWLLSFVMMLFNIGLARYVLRFLEAREAAEEERLKEARGAGSSSQPANSLQPASFPSPLGFLKKVCPEFYIGVLPVFAAIFLFMRDLQFHGAHAKTYFNAAAIQTNFDPNAKWEPGRLAWLTEVVRELTLEAASPAGKEKPAVIFWPEAALPYHVITAKTAHEAGAASYREFLQKLAGEADASLFIGAVGDVEGGYYNGAHVVTPDTGVETSLYYAKRHLVPFGEYVPLADVLPLRKVVPISQDCLAGSHGSPLLLNVRKDGVVNETYRAGTLICYEDVFPELGLELARRGADFIAVLTNDAWYGREAGAYQHAAHSAVLAASLRLPVVRCGNNGWSGVFNSLGQQTPLLRDGSIYFRGTGSFKVRGLPPAVRQPTFFMTHGNWAVLCSALFAFWALLRTGALPLSAITRRLRKKTASDNEPKTPDTPPPAM